MYKTIIASLILTTSLWSHPEPTPIVPHGTPAWAYDNDVAIAQTIMGEARGEGPMGMLMVADVIYTRMIRRELSAFEVVAQPHQFSGYGFNAVPPTPLVWAIVKQLRIGQDPLPGVAYDQFRAIYRPVPSWAKDAVVFKGHVFFNEGGK